MELGRRSVRRPVGGASLVDRQWRELDVSWWVDEELTDEQIEEACRGDRADIMIFHDCPSGVSRPLVHR